jgi:deoxyhypusine synthase
MVSAPPRIRDLKSTKGVGELTRRMRWTAYNARRLGEAREILLEMAAGGGFNFLGLAGALVPGGLRGIIVEMIRRGWFGVVVSTGANVTHDLAMAFGMRHYQIEGRRSDSSLRARGLCRIYDLYAPNRGFADLERGLGKILRRMPTGQYASHELLDRIGAELRDRDSFIRAAHEGGVRVLVPAITDSIVGFQVWMFSQFHNVRVDPFRDLDHIVNLQFDLKARKARTGALILGGGVPKNYILQSALFADKAFDYAVQITTDRPEFGGLSGATLEEAKSWGKVSRRARTCTVYCDATIALPVLVSSIDAGHGTGR